MIPMGGGFTSLYLIAVNDSLFLTSQNDSSYKVEIPFSKIVTYSYNGEDRLDITIPYKTGFDTAIFRIVDKRVGDIDAAFNRYALKHANIIDYIAARVPKKEVNIRL